MIDPIRLATTDDITPLARVLAKAFVEDPFTQWMVGPDRALEPALELLYAKLVRLNLPHGCVFTNETQSAVAVWRPPHKWKLDLFEELSIFGTVVRVMGPGRFCRLLPSMLALQKRHPKGPYAQLVVLGVAPLSQGRGLGGALLRPAVDDWNTRGISSYLETSRESNIAIYERYGFKVTDVLSIPNGPNVWFMWRDPLPARGSVT